MIANYCETYNNLIPVAFVLGFFVTLIVGRWWNQFIALPWPDRMALFVTATIQGHDDRGRLMRRTIMRYLCLAFVMMVSSISTAAKKRFPSLQHLTDAGRISVQARDSQYPHFFGTLALESPEFRTAVPKPNSIEFKRII